MKADLTQKSNKIYFSITGLILLVLAALVARPYLNTAILAVVVAYIAQPLYKSLLGKMKPRKVRASVLSTIIVLLFTLVIFTILVFSAIRVISLAITELNNLGLNNNAETDLIQELSDWINNLLVNLKLPLTVTPEQIITNVQSYISQLLTFLLNTITSIGTMSVSAVINLVIFFGLLFLFIPQYDGMILFVKNLSPFEDKINDMLLSRALNTAKSMVWGLLIIALIQGGLAGIMLYILGNPNTLLLTVVVAVFSFFPFLGTGLVIVPIIAIYFFNGEIVKAIVLGVFQIIVIGNIDTILRAKLIPREARMPLVISFIAILGGLAMFGIWGLVYGPVIFSLLLAVIEITQTRYFPQPATAVDEPASEESESGPEPDPITETVEESTTEK
jgi:predicted PurR-regulated permease PerM